MGRFLSVLNRWLWILVFVLGLFAGSLWIYKYSQTGMTPTLEYTAWLFGLAALILVLAPIIALVHELGHAVAAWLVGYRVHFIAIMNWGFAPETGRFHKVQDDQFYEMGGFVQFTTPWQDDNKWKDIFVYAAGVLACFLLALIVYLFGLFDWYGPRFSLYGALAIVAVSLPNLVPFSFSNAVGTDGKHILERLRGSGWSKEIWAANRAWAAQYGYIDSAMSDTEWAQLKNLDYSAESEYLCYLAKKVAWERTDVENYLRIHDSSGMDPEGLDPDDRNQFIVMSLLAGRDLDPSVKADFEAEDINAESSIIVHFANVLIAHRYGSVEAAKTAVAAARKSYIAFTGQVADEEEAIFSAVEKGGPLPELG